MGPGKLQYDLPTGVTVEHRKSHTVALGVYCRFLPRSGVVVGFANGCRVGAGAVITDHEMRERREQRGVRQGFFDSGYGGRAIDTSTAPTRSADLPYYIMSIRHLRFYCPKGC